MDQTVRSGIPNHEALAALPIAAPLSDAQREGRVCAWGGETLIAETAVDLGSRKLDGRLAFPRACRACVSRTAMAALLEHTTGPDACHDCRISDGCDTGAAFRRLVGRGGR